MEVVHKGSRGSKAVGHTTPQQRDPLPKDGNARAATTNRPATAHLASSAPSKILQDAVHVNRTSEGAGPSGRNHSVRPQSAHSLRAASAMTVREPTARGPAAPARGKLSIYDHGHEYLGPKVLRDYDDHNYRHGSPLRPPTDFLKRGEGASLAVRNTLSDWLKLNPANRDPAFQPGTGGLRLSWEHVPEPNTIFRYLYDNGTIDFITLRPGGITNHILWGKPARTGAQAWDRWPSEVNVAKWLPIFLEGIREYQEPYRFLAIRGSEALIVEAGEQLHDVAVELVPPFRKALETREPTVVAVAVELMNMTMRVDQQVAKVWLYQFWQFAQVLNLFLSKPYKVNMGYNTRHIAALRQLIHDFLILLEEGGGEHATGVIRRYARGYDPAVTAVSMARRTAQVQQKEGYEAWKPFTLF